MKIALRQWSATSIIVLIIGLSAFATPNRSNSNGSLSNDCKQLLSPGSSGLSLAAIHYDKLNANEFQIAIELDLQKAQQNLENIRNNPEPATFSNTIEALEYVSRDLDYANNIFSEYLNLRNEKELIDLNDIITPKISDFVNSIYFDVSIYKKVEKIYQDQNTLKLNQEQIKLLENTYNAFISSGVNLNTAQKNRLNQIDSTLSTLSDRFKNNLIDETKTFKFIVKNLNNLEGLPTANKESAAQKAQKMGFKNTWVFTLDNPSYLPFMKYIKNRELRKEFWLAYSQRGQNKAYDNRPVLLKIAKLREEKAHILGFKNYADYILKNRMAKNIENVRDFLYKLAKVYKPAAQKDLIDLENIAGHTIEPWDLGFYTAQLLQKEYGYNDDELRPYFTLDNVLKGAFYVAEKLYGITFTLKLDLPTWNKNVRAFEVRDRENNFRALFYLDPFPRDEKCSGAHCSGVVSAGVFDGVEIRPHVFNVANVTPPVGDQPALLSLNDGRTLFHELGHGLHQILTQVKYPSLAGFNVEWDGVELPSQLNEKWQLEDEALNIYARHFKTGERIPQELIDKVRDSENFQAGLNGLRQVTLATIDLAWHTQDLADVKTPEDVIKFENKAASHLQLLNRHGANFSTGFSHIFSGGYAAGYYSYKWADVLAADAFEVFKCNGVYDAATADRFAKEVLEKGGTQSFDILYRNFRGCDADPDALLRSEGLLPPK
jgi:peptidyl-dipeptidase Dcp